MELVFEEHHRNVPDDELLQDLRDVADRLGKTPTMPLYNQHGKFHAATLARRFGKWSEALDTAGLPQTRSKIGITDDELMANIESVWEATGHQPRYAEMNGPHSDYCAATYANRYGGWTAALHRFRESLTEGVTEVPMRMGAPVRTRHVNWRTRFQILKRDGFKCVCCGASPALTAGVELHIDHIVPWSRGGSTDLDNLRTLCETCNIGRSNIL